MQAGPESPCGDTRYICSDNHDLSDSLTDVLNISLFAGCMQAIDCKMVQEMKVQEIVESPTATFMHQVWRLQGFRGGGCVGASLMLSEPVCAMATSMVPSFTHVHADVSHRTTATNAETWVLAKPTPVMWYESALTWYAPSHVR